MPGLLCVGRTRLRLVRPRPLLATCTLALALLIPVTSRAQDATSDDDVGKRQAGVTRGYEELEKKIHQIAVAISGTDPEKAARLQRAYTASRQEELIARMEEARALLGKKDFSTANITQKEIVEALERILEILESDDARKDPSKLDPKRLEALAKELDRVLEREKEHKAESEKAKAHEAEARALEAASKKLKDLIEAERKTIASTQDAKDDGLPKLAADQRAIAEKAAQVSKEIEALAAGKPIDPDAAKPEAGEAKPGEAKPGEAKPGEGKPGEAKPGEAKPGEAKPGEAKPGEGKPGEGKAGEGKAGAGKPGEGKAGAGKPGEGKPSESSPQQNGAAQQAAESMQSAQQAMAQAGKQLDEAKKDPALERERKALEDLEKARAALDEKRMQIERLARFEKMKADQEQTRRDTSDLEKKMGPQNGGEGKSGSGKQGKGSQSQGEVPGRRNVQRAEDEMKRAGDDLENRYAKDAEEKQQEAIAQLEQAKDELREALIQARRREQEEVLKALGQRFVAMLEKQKDLTKRTEGTDAEREAARTAGKTELTRAQRIEIGKLAQGEGELRDDCNGALDMIREEGSTAILPTVVSEVALDLGKLAELLGKNDTGRFVVSLQKDVERSLEELIEVIKKEIEERKKNGGGGGGGGAGEQEDPLLPASAELKMIRAQQVRVNDKTKQFDVGRTPEKDLSTDQREACRHIAEKQGRVADFTRKLHMKLNKEE